MNKNNIDNELTLSSLFFETVDSVRGYGFLHHAVCSTLAINPPL